MLDMGFEVSELKLMKLEWNEGLNGRLTFAILLSRIAPSAATSKNLFADSSRSPGADVECYLAEGGREFSK